MAPTTPVLSSNGVSITPRVSTVLGDTTTVTVIGPGILVVPVKTNEIVPVPLFRPDGNGSRWMPIDNVAGPVPDAGVMVIKGSLETAVHETVPDPLCVSRTV